MACSHGQPVLVKKLTFFFFPNADESPVIIKYDTEAGDFVEAINDLRANGGGDCPEYTFTGMLEALNLEPKWGSPMYVFTDAGPKDATDDMIEEVKYLASEEYGVTINFFTTGKESCSGSCWFSL